MFTYQVCGKQCLVLYYVFKVQPEILDPWKKFKQKNAQKKSQAVKTPPMYSEIIQCQFQKQSANYDIPIEIL